MHILFIIELFLDCDFVGSSFINELPFQSLELRIELALEHTSPIDI